MSGPIFMPFLVEKYLKKTRHLSLEEHGAYCLLLLHMWQQGGNLPDNDKDLARLLGVSKFSWNKLKIRLENFFEFHGGLIMQKRLQKQWNYAAESSAKSKAKASFAAKRRWEKERGLRSINGVLEAMPQALHVASPKQCPSDAILRKKDIPIPLSNTVGLEEGSEQEPIAGIPARLNTPLLRRSA